MSFIKRNVPNCITLLNLMAGVVAIICAFHGPDPWWGLRGWEWSAIFIAIGAAADFLDGFFARLLKAYSELGKELDSLSDLVSFGVAPAMLVFNMMEPAGAQPWLKWFLILIPAVAGLRLARFNIDTRQTSYFIGMPVPANAIFWIGFASMTQQYAPFLLLPAIFIPVLLLELWLMVSPLRLMSLKFHDYRPRGLNLWRYALVLMAGVAVFTMGVAGLMWLIAFYVLLSLCIKVD